MKPYENLAMIYDNDWGKFSISYMQLINHLSDKYDFKPDSVLDIACGTGMLAAQIYNQGYNVCGIDISKDMINIAKQNNPQSQFEVADMTNFHMTRKFDLITCAFDSINYLTEDGQVLKAFANTYSVLKDSGYLIFDINTPALYEEKHFGVINRKSGNVKFKQILEYDKDTRIGTTIFDFGNDEREMHIQKAYTNTDMEKLLNKSGFMVLDRFKDFQLTPVDDRAYKIIYIAVKKPQD